MDSQFLVKFHEKPGVVTGEFRGAWLGLGPTLQSGSRLLNQTAELGLPGLPPVSEIIALIIVVNPRSASFS